MIMANKRGNGIEDIVSMVNDDEMTRFWGEVFEDVLGAMDANHELVITLNDNKDNYWTHKITLTNKKDKGNDEVIQWVVFDI